MAVELGRQVRRDHRCRLMFFQPPKDRAYDTVILVERGAARDEADRVPRIDEVAELSIALTQLVASDSQMNMGEEAAKNWAATASAVVRISAAVIGEAACADASSARLDLRPSRGADRREPEQNVGEDPHAVPALPNGKCGHVDNRCHLRHGEMASGHAAEEGSGHEHVRVQDDLTGRCTVQDAASPPFDRNGPANAAMTATNSTTCLTELGAG